jgi:hypothetical protein
VKKNKKLSFEKENISKCIGITVLLLDTKYTESVLYFVISICPSNRLLRPNQRHDQGISAGRTFLGPNIKKILFQL